nr:hypothetical protein [Tanacetum cinerariifolium]
DDGDDEDESSEDEEDDEKDVEADEEEEEEEHPAPADSVDGYIGDHDLGIQVNILVGLYFGNFMSFNPCSRDAKSRYNTRLAQLLPRHIYSPCIVNWDVLNQMGCDGEIDDMLRIRLHEARSDEEIFTFVAWIRAFNINEPIYVELCHEFYSTYEFDEVCAGDELQSKKIIRFRLGGRAYNLTLLGFARRIGLYQVTELDEEPNFVGNPQNDHFWFVLEDNWIGAGTHKESQICCGQFISKLARKCRVLTKDVIIHSRVCLELVFLDLREHPCRINMIGWVGWRFARKEALLDEERAKNGRIYQEWYDLEAQEPKILWKRRTNVNSCPTQIVPVAFTEYAMGISE